MPLDLKKVITQLTSLENQNTLDIAKNRIVSTYNLLQDAFNNQQKLLTKLIETRSNEKANFFFAIPELEEENISSLIPCDKNFSQPHIVVATDGSQINPSAHEFTNAFLINIGLTAIPYFNRNIPVLLNSEPHIYNSIEDINPLASEKRNFYDNVHEEDLVACWDEDERYPDKCEEGTGDCFYASSEQEDVAQGIESVGEGDESR